MAKSAALLDPVTPGELLWEEFMVPMGSTRYRLAKEIGAPAPRIGTSSGESVRSPLTRTFASAASSDSPTTTGCAPKLLMTSRSPSASLLLN